MDRLDLISTAQEQVSSKSEAGLEDVHSQVESLSNNESDLVSRREASEISNKSLIMELRNELLTRGEVSVQEVVPAIISESKPIESIVTQTPDKISLWARAKNKLNELLKENPPNDNIQYRPDRMYRCIGPGGYDDFLKTGSVGSKNKSVYVDVSFNLGQPAPRYNKGPSGEYILEAMPDVAEFVPKTHPFSGQPMIDINYRGANPSEITKDSAIRIFHKINDGIYEVVFDNIGDKALKSDE